MQHFKAKSKKCLWGGDIYRIYMYLITEVEDAYTAIVSAACLRSNAYFKKD